MNQTTLLSFIFLSTLSLFCHADTNVNISGVVVANPCTVDIDTVDKTVYLGRIPRADLQTSGQAGDWKDFDLLVKNCPVGTAKAIATFTGTNDTADATAWKNTGTSANVALRVTSRDHLTVIQNGNTMQVNINTSTQSANFPLSARVFTPLGGAVAGTFKSVISVDFTYQ